MLVEVIVQAVRVRVHQLLQPVGALLVLRFHVGRIDEQLHPQVTVDFALALRLGKPSDRVQVVRLDAIEVVLGLRVHDPEHGVRIGPPRDVRDAPVVANDGDALRLLLPGGGIRVCCRVRRGRGGGQGEEEQKLFHAPDCAIKSGAPR